MLFIISFSGWGGMLVCRRLLLIAAAIAASIEVGSASYHSLGISSSDYSGYPSGYAVYSGATSPESSSSSSSSTSSPTSETAGSNNELCRPSEFQCGSSGHCVAQDKYCDGENDCDDKSDEPRYCTREYRIRERTEARFLVGENRYIRWHLSEKIIIWRLISGK